jgi:glutathione S-transferase
LSRASHPDCRATLKAIARNRLRWFDGLIVGRTFIAGDRLPLADLLLFSFLDFGASVGQALDQENTNIAVWFERMKARPSVVATT